jgi:hypothetical protein
VGKPEKESLTRPGYKREKNNKIFLIGTEDLDWIRLAQDIVQQRGLAKTTLNLRVPQNVGNFLTVYQTIIFSR